MSRVRGRRPLHSRRNAHHELLSRKTTSRMVPSRAGRLGRNWCDRAASDETPRFARYAQAFVQMQRALWPRSGPERALPRIQLLALVALFEPLDGLPGRTAYGLFFEASQMRLLDPPL